VRWFAFHGERIYAAVEIGATWRLVEGSTGDPDFNAPVPRTLLHPDVHEVAVLSASADVLLAATMCGLYRSLDGGKKGCTSMLTVPFVRYGLIQPIISI
jgi:hypothetical protein